MFFWILRKVSQEIKKLEKIILVLPLELILTVNTETWGLPGGPVVKDSTLPLHGAQVQSLVGELRSHILHDVAKKWIKKKQNKKHRNMTALEESTNGKLKV